MTDPKEELGARFEDRRADAKGSEESVNESKNDTSQVQVEPSTDRTESSSDEVSDGEIDTGGDEEYECQVCGETFQSFRGVRSHEGQVHNYEREGTGDRPEGVRVQFRVPNKGFRKRFNKLAYGKLLMELDDRGRSELAEDLSQPDMQHAALQALLDNPDVWCDAVEDLYG
jgi:hypothetical protein